MFEDNDYKLYVIVNKNVDVATQMNATGHLCSGIMLKASDPCFHTYTNSDSELTAYLNNYPVIILQAKNSNQLSVAAQHCQKENILYNFFTTTMLAHSSEQQIQDTHATALEDLEFIAIAIYGETSKIKKITKKFSVLK